MAVSDRNRPVYMISVAAELAGVHPQTLRVYEAKGLVTPQRTSGNTRMYSQADIERLEFINELTNEIGRMTRLKEMEAVMNQPVSANSVSDAGAPQMTMWK